MSKLIKLRGRDRPAQGVLLLLEVGLQWVV